MATYSERIIVGSKEDRRVLTLQSDRLLLLFVRDSSPEAISDSLKLLGLESYKPEEGSTNPSFPLEARVVSVNINSRHKLDEFARELLNEQELPAKLAAVMPVYVPVDGGISQAVSPVPSRLLVRFRSGRDEKNQVRAFSKNHGLEYDKHMSSLLAPFHQFVEPREESQEGGGPIGEPSRILDLIEKVQEDADVAEAELDWLPHYALQLIPSDTHWAQQWNMMQIGMPVAWNEQTGGPGITIAVIDSGVDLAHPDLAAAITAPATHFNAQEAATSPGPYNANPSPTDLNGAHGSLCAGLAAALLNNATGIAGVAGGCQIMPLRMFPGGYLSWLAASINWARNNGAHVISMSLGASISNSSVVTALNNAWSAGIVLVAAAGNYYSASEPVATSVPVQFPARHANCLAVGASDIADQRKRPASADGEEWGSHYGVDLDVCAPGVNLWSTDIQGAAGWNVNGGPITWQGVSYPSAGDAGGDYFALMGGTSGATPQVAGLAALLRLRFPGLTNQEVRDIIERTCEKVNPGLYAYAHTTGHPNGTWHNEVGYGRVNAAAALTYADVMIADHSTDLGEVPSTELVGGVWTPAPFWAWQPYITQNSNPAAVPPGQPARSGQNNWLHAVVRNRGPATATNITVTWHIMNWAGTEFQHPADWNAANQVASVLIPSIPPMSDVSVEAIWPQSSVDIVAGFAHPCILVKAACAQDVGGDLGVYVQQYNNIAQHNISFVSSGSLQPEVRQAVLPFAVGHRLAVARQVQLAIDISQLGQARAWIDLNPDPNHPWVRRIVQADSDRRQKTDSGCAIDIEDDTHLTITCCGFHAKVVLRSGSQIKFPCYSGALFERSKLRLRDAVWTFLNGRELIALTGPAPLLEFSLAEGEIIPISMILEPDTIPTTPVAMHVGQLVSGIATGGVTLVVK